MGKRRKGETGTKNIFNNFKFVTHLRRIRNLWHWWDGLLPMFYFEVQTHFLVQYDMCVKDVRINCFAPSRKNLIDVRVCETGLAGSIQSGVCLHSVNEEFNTVPRRFPVSTWNSFAVTAQRLKEPRLERKKKN